jgi:hypothetical protein
MGHSGNYMQAKQITQLQSAGFEITMAEEKAYPWVFTDRRQMLDYSRTLFCMDKEPSDSALLREIERTVGFRETESRCELNWALFFVRAIKV